MNTVKDSHTHHISQQFNEELEGVKKSMLEMGGLVEKQVRDAIKSLINADTELADIVVERDELVNDMELNIDQECTQILAKRQPAASDLRLVLAVSKCISDLERIGDEAAKIARLAAELTEQGESQPGFVEVRHIGEEVSSMIQQALTAFARLDVDSALKVAHDDKIVDLEYRSTVRELITYMMEDPRSISRVLNIIWCLRALERVGDHAMNIGEHVIYLAKGLDVRHMDIEQVEDKLETVNK
ncbi:phosphate signaling complex protein PhoU [Litoribacillus peritrichatus]|uniref:Phosphate-specific transport system accessory protein PhoU n=1 Tax=Litoribacillus peritrichatus TaxID=718191 RepID=A0ABP7MJU8_9GAMM